MRRDLGDLREDYGRSRLRRADLPDEPLELFGAWLDSAGAVGLPDPNAMALATAAADGAPSCRFVLLKGFDARGLVFFTHYDSRKGRELDANPRAAATFWWPVLERQVRIEGTVRRAESELADAYFATRPEGSRLAAAASAQSKEVPDRATLERRVEELRAAHPDGRIPRPADWGGYRLAPHVYEFWQGGRDRLHDRFRFTARPGGGWTIARLAP